MKATANFPMGIVLASHNSHKLEELSALLSDMSIEIQLAGQLNTSISWQETGNTFAANAQIKARAVKAHTGDCVLADDSGLQVASLAGAPGVYSSRYAGAGASDVDNNQKLLQELEGHQDRSASFVCCLCFIDQQGQEFFFEGTLAGSIVEQQAGANGFGYDPVFYVSDECCTLAELSSEHKNAISHRFQAIMRFREFLGAKSS